MKTFFIFCLILSATLPGFAQTDSWKIYLDKKLLLSATEENVSKNVLKIKRSDLNKGQLTISYIEATPNKEWIRTIMIMDEKDSTMYEKSGVKLLNLSGSKLKKLAATRKKIMIYTHIKPKDPSKAMLVKIRRVHLCTLEIE